jgi:hypothetical protein
MWENWYLGVLVCMNAGVLVLGGGYWYSGVLVRTNAGVLVRVGVLVLCTYF